MTDKLKKQPATKGNEPPCSVCSTIGSSRFCKSCHDIFLCERCTEAHDSKPITRDHKLLGVCTHHGKPAEFYCENCSCAACSVCLISMHPGKDHAILPMIDVSTAALDVLRGIEEDVNTTLTQAHGCQKMIWNIVAKIKGYYAAEIAKKKSETKEKSAEEQQQLQQVQREIEATTQKLKELQLKETKIKERQKKMVQATKTDIAKDEAAKADSVQKVSTLMRELFDVTTELSNGFATSQELLKISTFTAENVNLLLETVSRVDRVMMSANIKVSEAKRVKQDMEPLIKVQYFFHKRHSNGLILSEDDTVASWIRNTGQFAQWPRQRMPVRVFVRGSRQDHGQFGAVMIQQLIAIGDLVEVEIEIEWKPPNPSPRYCKNNIQGPSMYAGFTNNTPESVDFMTLLQHFMTSSHSDFSYVNGQYGLVMCSCSRAFSGSVKVVPLKMWRSEDGYAYVGIGGLEGVRTYKPAIQSDLYVCLVFGDDIMKLKISQTVSKNEASHSKHRRSITDMSL